jgi:hypothetical protein
MKKIQIISLQKLRVTLPTDTARQEEQWRKSGSNTTIRVAGLLSDIRTEMNANRLDGQDHFPNRISFTQLKSKGHF